MISICANRVYIYRQSSLIVTETILGSCHTPDVLHNCLLISASLTRPLGGLPWTLEATPQAGGFRLRIKGPIYFVSGSITALISGLTACGKTSLLMAPLGTPSCS